MAEIRNYTPELRSAASGAHGVLRSGATGWRSRHACRSTHRPAPSRDREARRDPYLDPVGAYMDRLDHVDDVQRARLPPGCREAAAIDVPAAMHPYHVDRNDPGDPQSHLLWIGCHALDVGAV